MSPQWIGVDDEVMAKVQAQAKPFVDSPNDALRRLVGLGPTSETSCALRPSTQPPKRSYRATTGELLPLDEYLLPILRAVFQAGGSAWRAEVKKAVEADLSDRLTVLDRARMQHGAIRWENRLGFARLRLTERRHLRSDSQRGLWELTDAGTEELVQLEAKEARKREEATR